MLDILSTEASIADAVGDFARWKERRSNYTDEALYAQDVVAERAIRNLSAVREAFAESDIRESLLTALLGIIDEGLDGE